MGFPEDVPVLTDGRVTLRAHRRDDVDALVEMCRDPQMVAFTTVPAPYERGHAESFVGERIPQGWVDGSNRGWAIEAPDDDGGPRFAGNVDLRDAPVAEIGFGLHPWARGRGVMARAVRLAVDWAFTHGGVRSVQWRANVGNWPSRRVAWACGFRFDGTVRQSLVQRGDIHDGWVATLLPGDPPGPVGDWLRAPEIPGARVRLRPFRDADAARLAEAGGDALTQEWLAAFDLPTDDARARLWMQTRLEAESEGRGIWCCAADPDTDHLLAVAAVMHLGSPGLPGAGEVGYWAHPRGRGRGAVTEAVRLLADHAFRSRADGGLGLHRLLLQTAAGNAASRRVADKSGFREVGRQRRAERLPAADGRMRYDDLLMYDLLAEEHTQAADVS